MLRVNVIATKASNGKDYKNIYIEELIEGTQETAQPRGDAMAAAPQKMSFSGFIPEEVPF